jgi:hypothetical protein
MTHQIPSLEDDPSCECGALLEEGQTICRKCTAVLRWLRRHAKRNKPAKRRGEVKRPATRRREDARIGVSWS